MNISLVRLLSFEGRISGVPFFFLSLMHHRAFSLKSVDTPHHGTHNAPSLYLWESFPPAPTPSPPKSTACRPQPAMSRFTSSSYTCTDFLSLVRAYQFLGIHIFYVKILAFCIILRYIHPIKPLSWVSEELVEKEAVGGGGMATGWRQRVVGWRRGARQWRQ